jgi:hypothetical protein
VRVLQQAQHPCWIANHHQKASSLQTGGTRKVVDATIEASLLQLAIYYFHGSFIELMALSCCIPKSRIYLST